MCKLLMISFAGVVECLLFLSAISNIIIASDMSKGPCHGQVLTTLSCICGDRAFVNHWRIDDLNLAVLTLFSCL